MRNIFDRILSAQDALNQFTVSPSKIRKVYFFKRKRARPIFKKRSKNYISFEIGAKLCIKDFFGLINFMLDISKIVRDKYRIPVGVLFQQKDFVLNVNFVNPGVLLSFLNNQKIHVRPRVMRGVYYTPKNTVFHAS